MENKNRFNMNKNLGMISSHKRAVSSYDNPYTISKQLNNNNPARNTRQNKSYLNTRFNKDKAKTKKINGSLEDYKRLTKKYYNIIIGLQDELTKQTIKNYNLIEENNSLKQKINEIVQNQ